MSVDDVENKSSSGKTCEKCGQAHGRAVACNSTNDTDPLIGAIFADKYHIVSLLGSGGMSAVYKARHSLMDRMVAIKILVASDVASLKRFQLEAKLVSSLKHHNIVTVFDFGISPQGQPFLVMDFLEGHSLEVEIGKFKHLTVLRSVSIFCQACDALYYAHKRDLIHRDLKPSNFMIVTEENEDVLKLVDFGIAKHIAGEGDGHKLTKPGMVMGSPVYMSPEQCLGRKLDQRSDIYSLGCVMYECLTGKPPLIGDTVVETLHKHVHEAPRSFASVNPAFISIPEQLENIVFKCLERDPDKRYPSMLELWTDLELFQNSLKPATRITQTDLVAMKMPATLTSNPIEYVKENNAGLILIVVSSILLTCVFSYSQLRPKLAEKSQPEISYQQAKEAGNAAFGKANYAEAAKHFKEASKAAEKFDAEDPRLSEALNDLGNMYFREDYYPEAEHAFKNALRLRTDIFGKSSLPAAESMADLGMVYCVENKIAQAQQLLDDALAIRKANAGADSLAYADSLKDLAALYNKIGREKDAFSSLQKAMNIRSKTLGSMDPGNLETQISLAMAYQLRGDLQKANELYGMAHRTALRSYDSGNPIVADAIVGMASIDFLQKKYEDADRLFQEALEIRQKALGNKNVKTAEILSCLGVLKQTQGQDEAAEPFFKEALEVKEAALGPDDGEVKRSARLYAENLRNLNRGKDADALEERMGLKGSKPQPAG